MNPLLWLFIGIVCLIMVVLVRRIVHEISRHVAYYLPPTSIGQLSAELSSELAVVRAYRERLESQQDELATAIKSVNTTLSLAEMLRESMLTNTKGNLSDWVAMYGQEVFDSVIRNTSLNLQSSLHSGLFGRTTSVLDGYVLLHSLDDMVIDVHLDAQYVDPEGLRTAIVRLLEWEPTKVRNIHSERDLALRFQDQVRGRRDLELFLGKLGEHLINLTWDGKVALRVSKVGAS